jgi:hypothetical protein
MPSISRPLNRGLTYKKSYVSFVFSFDYTASAQIRALYESHRYPLARKHPPM